MLETDSGILLPNNYQIYVKPTEREISQRKLESYQKLAEIKQWGLRYPTKFLSEFVGVDLLDSQEYTFMMSWTRPYVLWLESRNAGKTTKLALYAMLRGLLQLQNIYLFWNCRSVTRNI